MTKPYRVVAKLKNNRLWMAIITVFPSVRTQSDAARALSESPTLIGKLLNMKTSGRRQDGSWCTFIVRIATTLKDTPEYLFDAELYGQVPNRVELELEPCQLHSTGLLALSPAPDENLDQEELRLEIDHVLATLSHREQRILTLRFGLHGGADLTLTDTGAEMGVSKERVRQIEAKALRKLRHPSRSKYLRRVVGLSPGEWWS